MTNQKSQTIRQIGPASATDVLPVQRYAPACRTDSSRRSSPATAEASSDGASRLTPSSIEHPEPGIPHPPSSLENPVSSDQHPVPTPSRKVSRNGKIARLAKPLRDMVNLMLQNNIKHSKIVDALDEHAVRVTVRNVSNWKTRGGYNEWRIEHERALEKHLRQDNLIDYLRTSDGSQLPEVGLQLAATQLSEFFLNPETEQQLATTPEKFARTISNLCRVTRHLHLLQKYRDDSARELGSQHNPERIKREIENGFEITRNVYSAEKLGQSIHESDIPHRNFLTKDGYAPA